MSARDPPHVHLFRSGIGTDFDFKDDNAKPRWILAVEELLEIGDITTMDWPVYSPDLIPRNYTDVWDEEMPFDTITFTRRHLTTKADAG